jgi:protein O-GlcNAc transferase
MKAGRRPEAIELWRRLQAANPKLAQPLVNIGLALRAEGDATAAIEHFERAIALDPNLFDAHFNKGVTYLHAKQFEPAIAAFETACRLRPDHARAAVLLAQAAQAVCDWDRGDRALPMLRREIAKALAGRPCAVTPWLSLRLPVTRAERKAIAAVASRVYEDAAAPATAELGFHFAPAAKPRLTIGYISGDFRTHPLMYLSGGMYKRHDRSRFRIIAYPVKPAGAEGDAIVNAQCDAVIDLSDVSDLDAANRIYADQVDILVDLSGFNVYMRPTIIAYRPAPVQVSYLNFAGTLSGRLYDYLIGDPVVTPAAHAGDYLETLARVSHCYQINDRDHPIGLPPPRHAEGLPDDAFVFACFCISEKIDRESFQAWMRILAATPHAVLWLFAESPMMQANLKQAAAAQGVDPARLIFAKWRTRQEHIARISLADVHFDTALYGAHSTGSMAMWAGVPLVTKIGETFPSRVGASMLRAAELPELIAKDWADYERICVSLAHNPQSLADLKARMAANRMRVPLFDTDRSVRDLESLYEQMWRLRVAGEPPQPLEA